MTCSTKVLKLICLLPVEGASAPGERWPSELSPIGGASLSGAKCLRPPVRTRTMFVSDFVWTSGGRPEEDSSSSSCFVASRTGEEGWWMVSISDSVRCFRIGFLYAGSRPYLSSVDETFIGRTGSTCAVWRGPYSHVTSESFNLAVSTGLVSIYVARQVSRRHFRTRGRVKRSYSPVQCLWGDSL